MIRLKTFMNITLLRSYSTKPYIQTIIPATTYWMKQATCVSDQDWRWHCKNRSLRQAIIDHIQDFMCVNKIWHLTNNKRNWNRLYTNLIKMSFRCHTRYIGVSSILLFLLQLHLMFVQKVRLWFSITLCYIVIAFSYKTSLYILKIRNKRIILKKMYENSVYIQIHKSTFVLWL